jgi:hypothetical protein
VRNVRSRSLRIELPVIHHREERKLDGRHETRGVSQKPWASTNRRFGLGR